MASVDVVTKANAGLVGLAGFVDTEIVKIRIGQGHWVILGRVMIHQTDGDFQWIRAKILHDQNVVLDQIGYQVRPGWNGCLALQATLLSKERQSITLECHTYSGFAYSGSLVAFSVDSIDVQ